MPALHHGKGFRPEPDDPKHWDFAALRPRLILQTLGDVDLRPFTSPRHDQKHTSSCVAQATIKALEIKRIQEHGHEAHVDLSRLAVYYLARELMFPPETHNDDGTYVSLAFDVLRRFGVPSEEDWPWDLDKINTPPSWMAMRKAFRRRIKAFYKIKSEGEERVQDVISALRAGNPVVFGTETGRNWHVYRAGDALGLPTKKTGRHATVLVGYKDGMFIGENSWGSRWGDDGFYLMLPSVIASGKSRDFWVPLTGFEPLR